MNKPTMYAILCGLLFWFVSMVTIVTLKTRAKKKKEMQASQEKKVLKATADEDHCDKCGQYVEPWDNAYALKDILKCLWPYKKPNQARHLLPNQHCEGSPSYAQYIPGQPVDRRPHAFYDRTHVNITRIRYIHLLKHFERPIPENLKEYEGLPF